MQSRALHNLVLAALMAALCTLLTLVIRIPSPMGGYLNLGDCAVLLSAWLLGPAAGAAAAGLGSALADLLGYPLYAPGTLVIKALMAAAAGWLFRSLTRRNVPLTGAGLVSGVVAEAIMAGGYFLFECWVLGMGPAVVVNLPANLVQGVLGITSALLVSALLRSSKAFPGRA